MSKNIIQVLLVENSKHDYRLIKRTLEKSDLSHYITWVQRGEDALQQIEQTSFDIMLLDYLLPDIDGLAVFQQLAKLEKIPVIFITGEGNEYLAVKAMKLGIQDYIVKDGAGDYLHLIPSTIHKTYTNWQSHQAYLKAKAELEQIRKAREEQYKRQAELARVKVAISQPDELEVLLNQITGMVTELLPATSGASIILWDKETDNFITSASTVPGQKPDIGVMRIRRQKGATRWILDNQQPLIMPNINEALNEPNPILREYKIQAYAGVPLLKGDEALGVLYALEDKPRQYNDHDLNFLKDLAGSAAVAITKVRLYEELRTANAQLQKQSEALKNYAHELEQRNSELDAFTHTVAHDLKSPLGLIVGYTNLLETNPLITQQEDLSKMVGVVTRTGHRMRNIVDELLLFAEVRKEDIHPEPLFMEHIIHEVQARLLHLLNQYEPTIELPDEWLAALGYAPWIEEVWANYFTNALKYGGTLPHIKLGSTKMPDGMVRFWIKDNGMGISPEQQRQLFTPFTQLSQARASGHGLGLSIVRRIVEKCGGCVGVESEVGQGSTFWFTLPSVPSNRLSI